MKNEYSKRRLLNSINKDEKLEPKTDLGKQILELRNQSKSYREIQNVLGCSKSTISYYCRDKTRKDVKKKTLKLDKWFLNFMKRITTFKTMKTVHKIKFKEYKNFKSNLKSHWKRFMENSNVSTKFEYEKVIQHIGGLQTKCYLTGRPIDITKDYYEFDHVIPRNQGGESTIENLGLTCFDANRSKAHMNVDEYLALCKEVLEYYGYTVIKN